MNLEGVLWVVSFLSLIVAGMTIGKPIDDFCRPIRCIFRQL